jgi:cobalt-zinc-cadmium efflux system outer membrane protein
MPHPSLAIRTGFPNLRPFNHQPSAARQHGRRSAALIAAATLAWVAAARAAEVPEVALPSYLSLQEAVDLFREHGIDLLLADAAVQSAGGDLKVAAAIPNPALAVSYGRAFNYDPNVPGCSGCSRNAYTAGLSDQSAIEETLTGKRTLRVRSAEAALAAARLGRTDAERVVGFQVKSQYVQLVAALFSLEFARSVQAYYEETLDLNRRRYPKVINEGELARVEVEKLQADQRVTQAEQDYRAQQAALAFLLGVRGVAPAFNVDRGALGFRVPAALRDTTPAQLLEQALHARPDLQQAQRTEDAAQASLELARRLRIPSVALSGQYYQMGSGQDAIQPPTATFGISLPLPAFYQQQGEIQRAAAALETQTLQKARLQAQIAADVDTAHAAFVSARTRVERMESGLLERAKKARDITAIQFRAGAIPLMDYLDAERAFVQTNNDYFDALADYWTAVFQIEAATGVEMGA